MARKKEVTRKIPLRWSPEVEVLEWTQQVRIKTGGYAEERKGSASTTRYEATGELSVACVASLILELRKALRQIRAFQTMRLDGAIARADTPL